MAALFTINLQLHCSSEGSRTSKLLEFQEHPQTVGRVKECIEKELHIPTCCQELRFQSAQLRDGGELLHSYRIRNGDTLDVHYSSEADVEELAAIIASMQQMIAFIQSIQQELSQRVVTAQLKTQLLNHRQIVSQVEDMVLSKFSSIGISVHRSYANKLYFAHNCGVDSLHYLHCQLLRQPWRSTPLELQFLEKYVLLAFSQLTSDTRLRSFITCHPVMDAMIHSFLRVPVPYYNTLQAPAGNVYTVGFLDQRFLNAILADVLSFSMSIICSLKEVSLEYRLKIVSNPRVMEQLLAYMHCLTFTYQASLISCIILESISCFEPQTHAYLSNQRVLDQIFSACDHHQSREGVKQAMLIRYFAGVLFTQLTIFSNQLIPLPYKYRICDFLKQFVETTTFEEIREQKDTHGICIVTSMPFIRMSFYPYGNLQYTCICPHYSVEENQKMRELEILCIQFGVLSLQGIFRGSIARERLVTENMVDYVTCLPWSIPKETKAREGACELVSFLSQKLQLQPPPLLTIVKAKLAAMHFGLEKVLRVNSVHELLNELQPQDNNM